MYELTKFSSTRCLVKLRNWNSKTGGPCALGAWPESSVVCNVVKIDQ